MTQTTARKNNISGLASRRVLPASASSVSYRLPDSRCDCFGHKGEWACLTTCPWERCLHDNERDTASITTRKAVSQIQQKSSNYGSIANY
jgi:hypothetical protein